MTDEELIARLLETEVLATLTRALGGDDLVERAMAAVDRLRKAEDYEWQDPIWETRIIAADLITALLARNAALAVERDEARKQMDAEREFATMFRRQRIAAEAEVARLREALDEIANQEANHKAVDRCACTPQEMLNEARAIARAALKGADHA